MRELQALCLDIAVYKVGLTQDTKVEDNEINLMEELSTITSFTNVNQTGGLNSPYSQADVNITPKFFIDEVS